eukprot:jgi/Chrzof1/7842/Cz02g38160.t1_ELIP5[v5.2]
MAMLGFVGIALTELSKQTSSLEQFGAEWGTVLLWSVLLTVGTLAPKFVSGSSLADLNAAATTDNLKGGEGVLGQILPLFDTNLELWSGRLAMLGVAGLTVVEVITGRPLF